MRTFVLAVFALALSVGASLAAPVTFLAYDKEKKELKVKDGDKEKTYRITDKTAFKNGDKDIKKQENALGRLEKAKADKLKFELTATGDEATEIKFAAAKKDKDK
jgi:hypothetical protein